MTEYRGIDVSNLSGSIDWRDVADSGVKAVFIEILIYMNFMMEQESMV